jgi:hypothetical protein
MLTMGDRATDRADLQAEEPFLAWMKREWLLVAITTGIALDWLPWVLSPFATGLGLLSGTKLVVLPGLVLATARRPAWITRPHVLGVAYLLTILFGGSLGWLAGNVTLGRLTAIVVNGFILIYFAQLRSLLSIRRVLAIVFVFSIPVPVVQCLTALGIISTGLLAALGVAPIAGDTRVFSIFDSTTVGFVPLMIPACLGGLLFVKSPGHRTTVNVLLAAGLVAFGATSALVAQQRSGVLAYGVSILAALMLYIAEHRKRLLWLVPAFGIAGLAVASYAQTLITPAQERFADTAAYEGAKELRLGGFTTFLSDVVENPLNPVPKGHQSLLDRTGVEPHLLVSEAYYEGGPLFLVAIVVILITFAGACVALARSTDARARTIGNCLCAFGCGAAVQVTLQTALALRLVPLVIGVGIAAERIRRVQARAA